MKIQWNKIFVFFLLFLIPVFLWLVSNTSIQFVTFLFIGILAILSRYWNAISNLNDPLEIVFLYLLLTYLTGKLGLSNYFPANNIVIIFALFGFLFLFKKQSRNSLYFIKGNTKGLWGLSILFALLSALGLATWFYFFDGNPHAEFMPNVPMFALFPMGLGFAFINAVFEEGLFRSIFLTRFSKVIGITAAIFLQAIWFSFLHFQSGFPSGVSGIVLTFLFGSVMGYLVFRTQGILVPILIHLFADFTLFVLIVLRMNNLF